MKYITRGIQNEIVLKLNTTPTNTFSGQYIFNCKHIQTNTNVVLILDDVSTLPDNYQKFVITSGDSNSFSVGQYEVKIYDITASTTQITLEYFTVKDTVTSTDIYFMQSGDTAVVYNATGQTATIPNVPVGLTAIVQPSGDQINLTWQSGSANTEAFDLWRKKGTGAYINLGNDILSYIYLDQYLDFNETYTYKIRAKNSVGFSNFTAEVSATTSYSATTATTAVYLIGSGDSVATFVSGNTWIVYSAPVSGVSTITFNQYTGVTAPATYAPIIHLHSYTGSSITDKPVFIGSGGTTVILNGTNVTFYSAVPTGTTISWGDIVGVLSGQTDLQNALNDKVNNLVYQGDIQYISGITSGNTIDIQNNFELFTGYTASTQVNLTGITADIQYLSGITSGNTADISYISGQTNNLQQAFTGHTGQTGTSSIHFTGHTFQGAGGTTVNVVNDVVQISSVAPTGTTVNWGNVLGNISGQTDLYQILTGHTADINYISGITSGHTIDINYISGVTSGNTADIQNNLILFTGYTANTNQTLTGITADINYLSGITSGHTADIAYISGITSGNTADISYISGVTDNHYQELTGLTSSFDSHTGDTSIHFLMSQITGYTTTIQFTGYTGTTDNTLDYLQTEIDNLSAIQSSDRIYIFQHEGSDIGGYEILSPTVLSLTGASEAVTTAGTQLVDSYVTPIQGLQVTGITSGVWIIHFHASTNIANNSGMRFDFYKRTTGGTETLLFQTAVKAINTTSLQEYQIEEAHTGYTGFVSSDRLVCKVYVVNTANRTVTWTYGTSANNSYVQVPIKFNTAVLWQNVEAKPSWLSGTTLSAFQSAHSHSQYSLQAAINTYTGTTAPALFVNVTGDTMTGALAISLNSATSGLTIGSNRGYIKVGLNSISDDGTNMLFTASRPLKITTDIQTQASVTNVKLGTNSMYSGGTGSIQNVAIGNEAFYSANGGDNNVFIGYQAGKADTTGGSNIGIGQGALTLNQTTNFNLAVGILALNKHTGTSSSYNVAIGYAALQNDLSGSNNIAVGGNALLGNTTGTLNVAIGSQALTTNTTSTSNTAVGVQTLFANTTSSNNTAVGHQALYNNTTNGNNNAFGQAALYNLKTGTNNAAFGLYAGRYYGAGSAALTGATQSTFLGNSARASANGQTNEVVIGYIAVGKGSNTVVLGNDSVTDTYLKGNVKLATANADLYITGKTSYIYTDASNLNTKLGVLAFDSFTGSTHENTAVGYQALTANLSGAYDTAVGSGALLNNTTGSYNTALGRDSLYSNITGEYSVAVGYNALYLTTANSYNTAIGASAGRYYGTGNASLTGATQSTFLGGITRASANGNTNEIVIGYNALGKGSNTVTLGNDSVTDTYLKGAVIAPAVKIVSLTTSTILDATHAGKVIEINSTGATTITLPSGMTTGMKVDIVNVNTGDVTLAAQGTLQSKDSYTKLANQYGGASVYHRGSNVWLAVGDLSA